MHAVFTDTEIGEDKLVPALKQAPAVDGSDVNETAFTTIPVVDDVVSSPPGAPISGETGLAIEPKVKITPSIKDLVANLHTVNVRFHSLLDP